MKKKILHLSLKKVYFDAIKDGVKHFEYRLCSKYWQKRLEGRDYDEIHLKCGYPKKGDMSRTIIKKYKGYERQDIRHEHFGSSMVRVFAIYV